MKDITFEEAKARCDTAATALAGAVCYGTSPEYLEHLKAEYRAADDALRDVLGIAHAKPYVAS